MFYLIILYFVWMSSCTSKKVNDYYLSNIINNKIQDRTPHFQSDNISASCYHVSPSSPQSELSSSSGSPAAASSGTYTALALASCFFLVRSFSIMSARHLRTTLWLGASSSGCENDDHSDSDRARSPFRSARLIWNLCTRERRF